MSSSAVNRRPAKRGAQSRGSQPDVDIVFELLKDQGTLEQASLFLRGRGLEHSGGSWKDMVDARLRPAYADGKLTLEDMLQHLAEVEEHGRQHVFLYQVPSGAALDRIFAPGQLERIVEDSATVPRLGQASLVNMPERPTITEVRREMREHAPCIVIKSVETRLLSSNRQERESGSQLIVSYDRRPYRAVNLLRIRSDGLAEVRIYSHRDVMDYRAAAQAMLAACGPLTEGLTFEGRRLDPLRDGLWRRDRRREVQRKFTLRNTEHKNATGNRLRASASASGATMFDDPILVASIDSFHGTKGGTLCERAAVVLRQDGSDGVLRRDLNLIFHGETNEFTIASKVTREEYEYVLETILAHNR